MPNSDFKLSSPMPHLTSSRITRVSTLKPVNMTCSEHKSRWLGALRKPTWRFAELILRPRLLAFPPTNCGSRVTLKRGTRPRSILQGAPVPADGHPRAAGSPKQGQSLAAWSWRPGSPERRVSLGCCGQGSCLLYSHSEQAGGHCHRPQVPISVPPLFPPQIVPLTPRPQ